MRISAAEIALENALKKQIELLSAKSETANIDGLCMLTGALMDAATTIHQLKQPADEEKTRKNIGISKGVEA